MVEMVAGSPLFDEGLEALTISPGAMRSYCRLGLVLVVTIAATIRKWCFCHAFSVISFRAPVIITTQPRKSIWSSRRVQLLPRRLHASEKWRPGDTSNSCDDDSDGTRTVEQADELGLNCLEIKMNGTDKFPILQPTMDEQGKKAAAAVSNTKLVDPSTEMEIYRLLDELGMTKDLPALQSSVDAGKWAPDLGDDVCPLPESEPTLIEQTMTSLVLGAMLSGGTYLFATALGDLLTRLEWVQEWRYLWPLVGFLYMADGIQAILSSDGEGLLREWWGGLYGKNNNNGNSISQRVARTLQVAGGLGTVIGGAYDAFMPVWMTGPNVVTNGGIGQDGAALLFVWTVWSVHQNLQQQCNAAAASETKYSGDKRMDNAVADIVTSNLRHGPLLSQIVLLAQLYKLGEGSFDELLF